MNYESKKMTKADKLLFIACLKSNEITGEQKKMIMEQVFNHCILLLDVDPLNEPINK